MSTKPEQPLRVGEWCYLPAQDKLVKLDHHGDVIATAELDNLCQKALNYFLANAHRLITRDELLNDVWGVRDVSDGRISRVIRVLRVSLGDDTKDPKYIETIPKRGFRFIADVEPLVPESAEPEPVGAGVAAASSVAQDVRDSVGSALEPENATSSEHPSAVKVASQPSRRRAAYWWTALAILVGIAAFVVRFGVATSTTDIPYKPFIPISKMAGAESHVAISSDGKYLVYVHTPLGIAGDQLILQEREGTERLVIKATHQELLSGPQFSADNKTIYYQSLLHGTSCEIRKLQLDDSRQKVVSDTVELNCQPQNYRARLSISPDGRFLVYPNYQTDTKNIALMLYNFASKKSERLTIAPSTSLGDIGGYFAPDSDQLAFVRDVGQSTGQIWLMSLSERAPKMLHYPKERYPAGISWLDGNKKIVYPSSKHELKVIDVASGQIATLAVADSPARDVNVVGDTLYAAAGGGWQVKQEKQLNPLFAKGASTSAEILADALYEQNPVAGLPDAVVSRRPGLQHVALRFPDGTQQKIAEFASDFFITRLEFSPDGKSLLVGYANELWIYTTGQAPVQINKSDERIGSASWGAKGEVVYYFLTKQGHWELHRYNLASNQSSFVSNEYDFYQESPAGNYKVWCKSNDPFLTIEREGQVVKTLDIGDLRASLPRGFVTRTNAFYFLRQIDTNFPTLQRYDLLTDKVESTGISVWGAGRLFTVTPDEKYILRDVGNLGDLDISYIKLK